VRATDKQCRGSSASAIYFTTHNARIPMTDVEEKARTYGITATVKDVRGNCPVYKPGDKMVFEDFYLRPRQSAPVCIHALSAMTTFLSPFLQGVDADELGIGSGPNKGCLQCPDPGPPHTPGGTVTFQFRRTRLKPRLSKRK